MADGKLSGELLARTGCVNSMDALLNAVGARYRARNITTSDAAGVIRSRIAHAQKLVISSDAPLSEIAFAAGFSDQAHFSNRFRGSNNAGTGSSQRIENGGRAFA